MVTNTKFNLPYPNNSTLNFQIKIYHSSTRPPPPKQISILSKINTPPTGKNINLPNLHDLERYHKDCACSLSTL